MKKRYKNIGSTVIRHGLKGKEVAISPGETGELALSSAEESFLTEIRALEVVAGPSISASVSAPAMAAPKRAERTE